MQRVLPEVPRIWLLELWAGGAGRLGMGTDAGGRVTSSAECGAVGADCGMMEGDWNSVGGEYGAMDGD